MKIYVLGSNSFVEEMVKCKDELCRLGYDGWIHPDYEAHVRGEKRAWYDHEMGYTEALVRHVLKAGAQ